MQLDKVKIKDDNSRGFKNINKSDFIEGTHEVYTEPKKRVTKPRTKRVKKDDDN